VQGKLGSSLALVKSSKCFFHIGAFLIVYKFNVLHTTMHPAACLVNKG